MKNKELFLETIITSITKCSYGKLFEKIPDDLQNKQKIVDIFEEIINDNLSQGSSVTSPSLYNISGIPGSGKSTWCEKMKVEFTNFLYISFDKIMEDRRLSYKLAEKIDAKKAFADWEVPARIAGYELLKRAVQQKKNILFEHSSSIPEHVALFEWLLKNDYEVHFRYVHVAPSVANERIKAREKQTGRIVPEGYIEERYKRLKDLLPQYKELCTTYKDI